MLYFAYGSNLDPDQMSRRCPDHRVIGLAALRDHGLAFPLYSPDWGGGVASVQVHHGETVWGVLYELSDRDLERLDGYEGCHGPGVRHNLYDRSHVAVDLVRPDDGSIPRRVLAEVYVGRSLNPSPPSRRYLDTLLRGARHHRLPDEYVARLGAVEATTESG